MARKLGDRRGFLQAILNSAVVARARPRVLSGFGQVGLLLCKERLLPLIGLDSPRLSSVKMLPVTVGTTLPPLPPLPPDSLRLRRLLLLQGGAFALVLLAAFAGSIYLAILLLRQEDQRTELRQLAASAALQLPLIEHGRREADGVVAAPAAAPAPGTVAALPGTEHQRLQWFDRMGVLLLEQGGLALPVAVGRAGPLQSLPLWEHWADGLGLWQPVFSRRSADGRNVEVMGYVRVALSNHHARQDLARLRQALLLGATLTLLLAMAVSGWLVQRVVQPLQGRVEILERCTLEAAHALHQPLLAMRAELAAMPTAARAGGSWQELERLRRGMVELLEDLATLVRLEAGAPEQVLERECIPLADLLRHSLAALGPKAAARRIDLKQSPPTGLDGLAVVGDTQELQRLFSHLLGQAIQRSSGGAVVVEVRAVAGRVRVAVADGSASPAAGEIGLAIAQGLARRHGGELRQDLGADGQRLLVLELPC